MFNTYICFIDDLNYFLKEMKRKERGKNPTRLEVWNQTHTRVGGDPEHPVYTTPAAMAIAVIKLLPYTPCTF